jgi:hypothetical protein
MMPKRRGVIGPRLAASRAGAQILGDMNMDEFGGGGFLRSVMIGFVLAVAVSFIYVWYR